MAWFGGRRWASTMSDATRALAQGVLAGRRASLSRAITLVESTSPRHEAQAEALLNAVLAPRHHLVDGTLDVTHPTFRIGICGAPGAGKSTFIEAFGMQLVEAGHKVAVLAVDPSSSRTGGSILGDKTRMEQLTKHPNAYVRPSPTRGKLGGIAQATNEVVLLTEAAGFDIVLVETVGLGQSEIAVDETVDMLLMMLPPASGDELQGSKKGIMEVVDLVVVTKADGDMLATARHTVSEYRRALQLVRPKTANWHARAVLCSAHDPSTITEVWDVIKEYQDAVTSAGALVKKRRKQNWEWMWDSWQAMLLASAKRQEVTAVANDLLPTVLAGAMSPRSAAREMMTTTAKVGLARPDVDETSS